MQQAKVVELVVPPGSEPEPVAAQSTGNLGSSWWIAGIVLAVLAANAALVWWRIKVRDPLKKAFTGAAAAAGLSREERRRVVQLAGAEVAPVALLISEIAMDQAAAPSPDDPVIMRIRGKLRAARV